MPATRIDGLELSKCLRQPSCEPCSPGRLPARVANQILAFLDLSVKQSTSPSPPTGIV